MIIRPMRSELAYYANVYSDEAPFLMVITHEEGQRKIGFTKVQKGEMEPCKDILHEIAVAYNEACGLSIQAAAAQYPSLDKMIYDVQEKIHSLIGSSPNATFFHVVSPDMNEILKSMGDYAYNRGGNPHIPGLWHKSNVLVDTTLPEGTYIVGISEPTAPVAVIFYDDSDYLDKYNLQIVNPSKMCRVEFII
jgi:hypothetical protein